MALLNRGRAAGACRARTDRNRRVAFSRKVLIGSIFLPASLWAAPDADAFRTHEYRALWGLDMINASQAYAMGYTGKGVHVGVADDGAAYRHPEFAGRARDWDQRPSWMDALGLDMGDLAGYHSTLVAGVLAAARDGAGMHGVAYDASLSAIPIYGDQGIRTAAAIREAVDAGARVINASYGQPVYPDRVSPEGVRNPGYAPQAMQTLHLLPDGRLQFFSDEAESLRYAAANDVVTVYSAGNEFYDHPMAARQPAAGGLLPFIHPGNHSAGIYQVVDGEMDIYADHYSVEDYRKLDGADPRLQSFDFRDLEGSFIAVVAVGRDKRIAGYSNRCGAAWRWCMAAPGGDVPNAGDGNDPASTFVYTTAVQGGYVSKGIAGTSFAAPFVSGSAAVVRQAFPYMTARQIVELLLTSADRSGHLADRAVYGRGLLDLGRAVRGPVEFGAEGFPSIFDVDTRGHDSWWRNDIGGGGGLMKRGAGTLLLTGTNTYTGPTTVAGGTLAVEGSIAQSRLTVARDGALTGSGTVGPAEVSGVVAPDQPGKPLRVAGDYVQHQEGVYRVRIGDDGQSSDRIAVAGAARLENGALQVLGIKPAIIGNTYTVLEAEGGVTGDFAPVANPYVFLDFVQGTTAQDPHRYRFAVTRNAFAFSAAARTPNQAAVARGLDSAGAGYAPYDATVMATGTEHLPRQFDLWSGESHASLLTAFSMQSWQAGQAALGRARGMQGGSAAPVTASQAVAEKGRDKATWARYTGSHDRLSGTGHAAALEASSSGILIGADASVSPATRLGAMAGFSNGSVKVRDLRSQAKLDTYTLGAYGATAAAGLDFRYGATYSWHTVSSRRDTGALGGAKGRYTARTGQLFGEAAAPCELGAVTIEPYAGLAYVATRRGRFAESGTAGLRADGATQRLGFSTLGLRAGAGWQAHDGSQWSVHGGAGWRHAYGGIQPAARMRFAVGDAFEVTGVPVARNALLVEGGIGAETPDGMRFGAGYSGQLARGAVSHAINAKVSWVF